MQHTPLMRLSYLMKRAMNIQTALQPDKSMRSIIAMFQTVLSIHMVTRAFDAFANMTIGRRDRIQEAAKLSAFVHSDPKILFRSQVFCSQYQHQLLRVYLFAWATSEYINSLQLITMTIDIYPSRSSKLYQQLELLSSSEFHWSS